MFKVTDLVSLKPPTGSGDRMQTVGYENTDSDMILPLVAHNRFENKHVAGLQIRVHTRFFLISYFSTKTNVVGTQKNRLDETVLLIPRTYV